MLKLDRRRLIPLTVRLAGLLSWARSNGVTITVSDPSPGIPDEHLKSVFLPFYRNEASRNRETGGTGLGLAIAQQLVSALRGTLTLANRDGGGLEARVEFSG